LKIGGCGRRALRTVDDLVSHDNLLVIRDS
jgi:hypothetical protein